VPEFKITCDAPVTDPIVTTWAAALLPIPIARAVVPTPRFTAPASLSLPRLRAVPPVKIVALPLREESPEAAIVVNDPAAGVPDPVAGGAANTAATFRGVMAVVSFVKATASAFVESCPIPETLSLQAGAPAMATLLI
jgi:hypothetical protein